MSDEHRGVQRALRAAVRSDLERVAMASLNDAASADLRRRLQT